MHGLACPDISYTLRSILEDDCSERGDTQGQKLLLFLFIKYWDDFHLELVDVTGQQAIVDHLDQILHYNKDVVRKSIQPVLHQVLDEYLRFKKNQGRIQTATTVICDALQSILSMSTNRDFRAKSLQLLKVSSTQEMKTSLQNTLQNIVQNRFLPSRVCYTKRVHSGDGDRVQSNTDSASPGASQENRRDTAQVQRIHAELSHSESDPSFTLVDSDGLDWSADPPQVSAETDSHFGSFERRIGTRKRQLEADRMKPGTNPASSPFKKPVDGSYSQPRLENVSTGHISSRKPGVQVSIPPRLTSETTDSFGVQCSPKQTINRKPTEDQEEYLWLREVSNLSDWTH
ncbi:type 2 DNA topoisomerase 6 subunit B-like [Scyliorhinus torazame]|uniref:type 2 DNA topoisomerase 6 subunit B-like n=1 Tax=Scyliorhinus torazame TaxID=75743 RepID=UPI003B5C28B2